MKSSTVLGALDARLRYLAPSSLVNRRFIAPNAQLDTARYEAVDVKIRDGRLERGETIDTMGFALVGHGSGIEDFRDRPLVESLYQREVCALVRERLAADLVLTMGAVRWTRGGSSAIPEQPHVGNVHVDVTPERARTLAAMRWRESGHGGLGYRRFVVSNCWRVISPGPQDWPLALCDFRSVGEEEGLPSVSIYCNNLPESHACTAPLAGEETLPAASVFAHSPAHQWYYYPNMSRDEVLLFKFYDSDPNRAWRAPHVTFRNPAANTDVARESVELRTIAYFL